MAQRWWRRLRENRRASPPDSPAGSDATASEEVIERSYALIGRYEETGKVRWLDEGARLLRQAEATGPGYDPSRPWVLADLAGVMIRRYERTGRSRTG